MRRATTPADAEPAFCDVMPVSEPAPPDPAADSAPAGPPAQAAAAETLLSAAEVSILEQMREDWDRPPRDHPDAVVMCNLPSAAHGNLRAWRWRGAGGVDEYESQFVLPMPPEVSRTHLCKPLLSPPPPPPPPSS